MELNQTDLLIEERDADSLLLDLEISRGPSNYFIDKAREIFEVEFTKTELSEKEQSALCRLRAEFELELGNSLIAEHFAGQITDFDDKLEMFKKAYRSGELSVALKLGDLEAEADFSNNIERAYKLHLTFASLGLNPYANLDAALVLAQDPTHPNNLTRSTKISRFIDIALVAIEQDNIELAEVILQQNKNRSYSSDETYRLTYCVEAALLARKIRNDKGVEKRATRKEVQRLAKVITYGKEHRERTDSRPLEVLILTGSRTALASFEVDWQNVSWSTIPTEATAPFLRGKNLASLVGLDEHKKIKIACLNGDAEYLRLILGNILINEQSSSVNLMSIFMTIGSKITSTECKIEVSEIDMSIASYGHADLLLKTARQDYRQLLHTSYGSVVDKSRIQQAIDAEIAAINDVVKSINDPWLQFKAAIDLCKLRSEATSRVHTGINLKRLRKLHDICISSPLYSTDTKAEASSLLKSIQALELDKE